MPTNGLTPAGGCRWLAAAMAVMFLAAWCGLVQAQAPAARPKATTAAPQGRPAVQAGPRAAVPAAGDPRAAAPTGPSSDLPLVGSTPKVNPATLQVMAVVNGEQISRSELGRECIRRYGEEVLESLVSRQLILAACQQRGVQITEQDVTQEVDSIAARFGLARDRWLALLQEERGFSEAQYKREVVWPMLALRRLAAEQIAVTQEELQQAFDSEFGARVRARLIAVDSQQLAAQARAEAVANPASFGEVSKKYSKEPGVAAAYGVIPPIRRNLGDPNLERIAFGLKVGEISQPIHVANMYYILKCEEQIPQQFVSTQNLAAQQKALEDRIRENKMRSAAVQMMDQMLKAAQVVNVFNNAERAKAQPGVAATVNGKPISLASLSDECIVRHGEEVLDGEINRKILSQELFRKKLVVTGEDIDEEVARAADAYGFLQKDGTPDKDRWLKSITEQDGATVDLYVRDAVWPSVALKKLVGDRVTISQEDLQRGFESNYGERVEVLAIVLSNQRQAQDVWEMARNNPTDTFFGELAQQYSVEPASRANGGKVPPIRLHGGSPLIEEHAFKLKPGGLSGLIAVENQFIILRCLGRTQPVQVEFAAVKKELEKDIQEKKLRVLMTGEFDRLRGTAQLDNFLARTTQSGKGLRPGNALTPLAPAGSSGARPVPKSAIAPTGPARGAPKTR